MTIGNVYIISDGTGETASTMTRAALVQYRQYDVNITRYKNIRTEKKIAAVIEEAKKNNGFIVYTVVSSNLRKTIAKSCELNNIPCVDLLGPMLAKMDLYFGTSKNQQAGLFRSINEIYYKRIEAIEFTVKHDDGKDVRDLEKADIVLVGISRTSKTPLSIFLSHKGWKVANIPLILSMPLPHKLSLIDQKKIVALTINPEKLLKIRKNRLEKIGDSIGEYASLSYIQREVEYAHSLFSKNKKWPVFDVTELALEEAAAEITRLISLRTGLKSESPLE